MPSLVFDELVIGTEIHGHRPAAARAVRHQFSWCAHVRLVFYLLAYNAPVDVLTIYIWTGGRAVSGVGRRTRPPAERWVGTYLSPAPQAVPQAADGSWDIFVFQPNKFESDIWFTSVLLIVQSVFSLSVILILRILAGRTSTHFFITR